MNDQLIPVQIVHDFADRIEHLGFEYMLSGSMAMMLYNYYRMTADIDIVIELKIDDAGSIIRAFADDYYVPEGRVRDAIARRFMFNVIHQATAFKIDLVMKKKGDFHESAFQRRQKRDFYHKQIDVITLEDLIVSKLSWAKESRSEKQLNDVENLLRNDFDDAYVRYWTEKLGVDDLLDQCLDAGKE